MAMAWVWTVMAAAAVIFGALTGRMAQVGAAALEGARSAVELCLSMAGVVCLWTGVMEVMERCGLAPTVRGEALTLRDFAALARALKEET